MASHENLSIWSPAGRKPSAKAPTYSTTGGALAVSTLSLGSGHKTSAQTLRMAKFYGHLKIMHDTCMIGILHKKVYVVLWWALKSDSMIEIILRSGGNQCALDAEAPLRCRAASSC